MTRIFYICLSCVVFHTYGQTAADFSMQSQACSLENIQLTNESTGTEFEWDFCENDAVQTPTIVAQDVVTGATSLLDIKLVYDDRWFGFVCDGDGNKVTRLDYGQSLAASPTASKLFDFNTTTGIEVARIDGEWFGLAGSFGSPSRLMLIKFGDALSNDPEIIEVIVPPGSFNNMRSIRLTKEGSDFVAFVVNWSQTLLTRINFGSSMSENVVAVDQIDFAVPTALIGLELMADATAKYAFVTHFNDGVLYKLDFGTSWLSAPVIQTVTCPVSIPNPTMLSSVYEGGNYYLFMTLNSGQLLRFNFGTDLSGLTPQVDDLGTVPGMSEVRGMSAVRDNGALSVMFTSFSSNKTYYGRFEDTACPASSSLYRGSDPPFIQYSAAGDYPVTLRVNHRDIDAAYKTLSVNVSALPAPSVTLQVENKQCLGQVNVFALQSDQSISTYAWALGDVTTSTDAVPTHLYAQPGRYAYSVVVTSANACNNLDEGEITVSDVPDFDPPASPTICTNQPYTFTNQTLFDPNYEPAWQWSIDGAPVSNAVDLVTVFAGSELEIQLETSLDGCVNSVAKLIGTIGEGPAVDFTVGNICAGTEAAFTNATTGDASSYLWTIDGVTSTGVDATYTFADAGSGSVKLSAFSSAGCENSKTEIVPVYSVPVPDFFLDLPPFSCSGSPSTFHDATPAPDDSNLIGWAWTFGDGQFSNVQDATHAYVLPGGYSVQLDVTTDKGCRGQVTKNITISESPAVDFIYSTPCVNTHVQFTASAAPTVDTWAWKIGNVTSQLPNPTHTFSSPGDYPTELTVTAANNCSNTVSNSVHVPVVPTIDISISSACVGTEATLSGSSTGSNDLTTMYSWDLGGGVTGVGDMFVYTFTLVGSYGVDVEATTTSGCVYAYSEDVIIHPIPIAGFTPLEEYGPAPLTVNFTNASVGATSYEWFFADQGGTSTSIEVSPTFTYTQLGTYQAILHATSDAGCTGSADGVIHVIVPHADLVLEDLAMFTDPASNLTKGVIQIRNNGNYPISAVDLVIDMGSGVIITDRVVTDLDPEAQASLATNSSLSFQSGGVGFICVTASIANDENTSDNAECLATGETSKLFDTYPNPSDGHLSIQVVGTANEELRIEIVNGTGADSYSKTVDVHRGLNILELDLTTVSPGIYLLRMSTPSSGVTTQRIAIQR